jgi:membrane associated rhomboid family serine protease
MYFSLFVQFSLEHLFIRLLTQWLFGYWLERRYGPKFIGVIVCAASVVSGTSRFLCCCFFSKFSKL